MNPLLQLPLIPGLSLLGHVLVHFLWQGAVIAGVLALGLGAARHASAQLRHNLACLALAAMALCPLITALWLVQTGDMGSSIQESSQASIGPAGRTPASPIPEFGNLSVMAWIPWVSLIWFAGTAVLSLRLLGGWLRLHRVLRNGTHPAASEWQDQLRALQHRFQILTGHSIQLLETVRAQGPMVVGVLKPVILFPAGLLASLPPAQVEALLLHELAHLRHRDFIVNLAQRLMETLLFYHPAVWWVSGQIQREREHRCDDWVASVQGTGRRLAEALLVLAEQQPSMPSFALAADGGSVTDRIRRLLGASPSSPGRSGMPWRRVVKVAALLMIGFVLIRWTMAVPVYQSTARIRIDPGRKDGNVQSYDPFSIVSTIEILRSARELSIVSERLGLAKRWSVSPEAAIVRLRNGLDVRQYRNTPILEITVSSPDRNEAAELANAVAATCRDRGLRAQESERLEANIQERRNLEGLDALIAEADQEQKAIPPEERLSLRYREKLKDIEMLWELKRQQRRETLLRQLASPQSRHDTVEIIDSAIPSDRPFRRLAFNR